MDKTRHVRRAKPSRFSSASTHLSTHSGLDFKKMRRDKVRRLSFVDRLCDNTPDSEMPCVQSDDEEDEYHPCATKSKRIKLPTKVNLQFFDDSQKVDHSSVPRKLRSAIRKRRRESVSPQFPEVRKLKHSANRIEPVKRDVIKKSKLKQCVESEGSPGLASVMPISNEEEEVAGILYALAEMFPDSDKTEPVKSTVPEVEKDLQTPSTTTALEIAQHSLNTAGSADETERIQFSDRRTEFDMHRYKKYPTESPKSNCTKVPIFSKTSSVNENRLSNSSFPSHSQLSREIGLKRPMHNLNLANEINKGMAVESVATFKGQNEVRHSTRENRNNGSALWPGLSSTSVHSAKTLGSPVKLSAAKLPTWLGIAKACSSRKVAIAEKESQSVVDEKKLRKKCPTHVYISRLIKVLKVTEEKDSLPLQPTRLTAHERSTQGTISEDKKLNVIKNGPTGVVFTNDIACSGGKDTPGKLRSTILLHKRLHDDQQGSTNSGPYTTENQSSNLFPAMAGSLEHERGGQVNQHPPERSTQSNVPFLHPFTQSCTTNPLSLPKYSHVSTSFVDSADAGAAEKVQMQLPPYLSNSTSNTSSLTGLQKQQQHQQWLWGAQLTAPCKPEEFAAAASHVTNWQNSRQDFPHIMQYAQLIHPAALEVLGPRYIPVSPQQQHLFSTTSLYPQRVYNHQLSTSNMANGGVLRPDSRAAMPLLCKEHT